MTEEAQIEGMMTKDIPIGVLIIEDCQIDSLMIQIDGLMIVDWTEDAMIEMIVIVGLMTPEVLVDSLIAHQWIDVMIDIGLVKTESGFIARSVETGLGK